MSCLGAANSFGGTFAPGRGESHSRSGGHVFAVENSATAMLLRSVFSFALGRTKPDIQLSLERVLRGSFASREPDRHPPAQLVLVNWNIERGVRISEILQALRGPLAADVYVLQEVDLHTRRTGYRNVAEGIARELGLSYAFGIEFEELAEGGPGMPAYHGQAVLSRLPIVRVRVLRFRNQLHNWGLRRMPRWAFLQPRRGGRMALVAEIQVGNRTLVVYDTHLESKARDAGRALQSREILDDMQAHYSEDTPVIVAGDLNTREGADSPVIQELEASGFQDSLRDHKGPLQTKTHSKGRIDWIFLRHLNYREAAIPKLVISDHFPLTIKITVPQPS